MKRLRYVDMVKELLTEEEFLQFEQRYTQPVQKSIKPLFSRIESSLFQETLACDGRKLRAPEFFDGGKVYDDVLFVEKEDKQSLGSHWFHQAGLLYVQEMAAGMAAQVLMCNQRHSGTDSLGKGAVVLDMCAAPGGKSIQLADRILMTNSKGRQGLLISNELNSQRRKALLSNLERCGIANVVVTGYDGRQLGKLLYEQCDKVLLDAPCSGEGMQYKSDFKVYGWNEKAVRKLAYLQKELLISGLQCLKVGGELVYSTCTTNVIENEGVIAEVLEMLGDCVELVPVDIDQKSSGISSWRGETLLPDVQRQCVARFWPHIHHTGGFFIAKFKKVTRLQKITPEPLQFCGGASQDYEGCLDCRAETKLLARTLWNYSDEVQEEVWGYLQGAFGLEWSDFSEYFFVKSTYSVQVIPKCFEHIAGGGLFFEQVGLPILKVLSDGRFVPLLGLVKVFGGGASLCVLDIDVEQVKCLMQKADLQDERLAEFEGRFVLLRWKGVGIGLVSVQNGIGKNKW